MEEIKEAVITSIIQAIVLICFALLFIAFMPNKAGAAEIPEATAVHCILGEARGEGDVGIKLLASALRNRGTTKGVYGCRADLSKEMSYLKTRGIYAQAVKAWRDKSDLVRGATYWGGKSCDKAWLENMARKGYVLTVEYRGHKFYRKDS
jgi:hypothetical protein